MKVRSTDTNPKFVNEAAMSLADQAAALINDVYGKDRTVTWAAEDLLPHLRGVSESQWRNNQHLLKFADGSEAQASYSNGVKLTPKGKP